MDSSNYLYGQIEKSYKTFFLERIALTLSQAHNPGGMQFSPPSAPENGRESGSSLRSKIHKFTEGYYPNNLYGQIEKSYKTFFLGRIRGTATIRYKSATSTQKPHVYWLLCGQGAGDGRFTSRPG